jgi:cytochrome P450
LSFVRFPIADTEAAGLPLLKGMPVEISQQAANFDPLQYPDPLRFDICRKPQGILTFGSGAHFCIGFQIARVIMRIGLEEILRRFPRIRLHNREYVPLYHGMHGEIAPVEIPLRIDCRISVAKQLSCRRPIGKSCEQGNNSRLHPLNPRGT